MLTSVLTPVRCDGDTAVVNADWIELYFDPGKVGRRAAVETGVARLQIATLVVTGRQVEPVFSDGLTGVVRIPKKHRSLDGSSPPYHTVDFIEELGLQTFYPIDELAAAGNFDYDASTEVIVHMHTFVPGAGYKCSSCPPYAVLLRRGSPVAAVTTSATQAVTLGLTSPFSRGPGARPPTLRSGWIGPTVTQAFIWNGSAWEEYPVATLRRVAAPVADP